MPRPQKAALRGGGASLLTLAALIGFTILCTRQAAQSSRYRVEAARIAVSGVPDWLPGGAEQTGLEHPLLSGSCSVFDDRLPRLAVQSAESKPWVREVRAVERTFPNALTLEVELRTPIAQVQSGQQSVVLDAEGVVLESSTKLPRGMLPQITANQCTAPAPGSKLNPEKHAAWLEALALLRELRAAGDHPALETLQIREVRVGSPGVARKAGAADLCLVTDKPALIRWGVAPGMDKTAKPTEVMDKLNALRLALTRHEGLVGVQEVDLTYPGGCDIRKPRTP